MSGFIPRTATVFQVKASKMPRAKILSEMAPQSIVRNTIAELAQSSGAYIIVSSKDWVSDSELSNRKLAMKEAIKSLGQSATITLDFYDRQRIATWVNLYPGLIQWVRTRLGLPLSGWQAYSDWSSKPQSVYAEYKIERRTRLFGPSISERDGIGFEDALNTLRSMVAKPKGCIRLVGLSGVGKTRLVQALFDDRVGKDALNRSEALYTEISDSPEPTPQNMLGELITAGSRVVMIIDNCGAALHQKLASAVANSNARLSLITIEYDINDDEPQDTQVFRLEPGSSELIEALLESRYPAIPALSRKQIASFSEGNARIAFALAETAKYGDSLANLKDSDLFKRLFYQQKGTGDDALMEAAKVCALLYSFDGETLGENSELSILAKLAGQSVDDLYKHVAELRRRQLVQKRGRWRAILPQALALRLARVALTDNHFQKIETALVTDTNVRVIRSFSRRLGHLHDDNNSIKFARKWLSTGGLLAGLGNLNDLGKGVFENVAPIDCEATLTCIERAAEAGESWFFGEENQNKRQIVRALRSLAYDPALFERSVLLLTHFTVLEPDRSLDSARDRLRPLFSLYLSGTHASAAQRTEFVTSLLQNNDLCYRQTGLLLFEEMLKTQHFGSSSSFEFGARKRDFGFLACTSE